MRHAGRRAEIQAGRERHWQEGRALAHVLDMNPGFFMHSSDAAHWLHLRRAQPGRILSVKRTDNAREQMGSSSKPHRGDLSKQPEVISPEFSDSREGGSESAEPATAAGAPWKKQSV